MGLLRTVLENLGGAWQVMWGKPEGISRLDTSLEGFWRSFAAVILVVPFSILALVDQQQIAEGLATTVPPLTEGRLILAGIVLLIDWFAFPLLFAAIARPFGLASRYVPYIVARNWSAPTISAITGVFDVLHFVGVIPTGPAAFLPIIVLAIVFRFAYVIARTALAVSMGMALPIAVLDLLISLTIWSAFARFA